MAACGGGGGGGGGQGSDFGTGLAIDVSTLSFSAVANENPPPAQTVHATISATDAATLGVGYANGTEVASWLKAMIGPAQNPVAINFSVTPFLTPGTFTAHPSIGIFRVDGTPIAVRAMTVTYQVLPQPPGVSPTAFTMRTPFNNPAPTISQVFVKGSGTWTATVDYASGTGWLKLGNSNAFPQTGPGGTALNLSPVTTTPVGTYSATLHVAIGGQVFDVAITLEVIP